VPWPTTDVIFRLFDKRRPGSQFLSLHFLCWSKESGDNKNNEFFNDPKTPRLVRHAAGIPHRLIERIVLGQEVKSTEIKPAFE